MLASLVTIHLWGASSNLMRDWCQIVIRTPQVTPLGRCRKRWAFASADAEFAPSWPRWSVWQPLDRMW